MSKRAKIGIEHGKFRNPEYLIVELDKRLAEDDANPNDTVSWEIIRADAQARWNNRMQPMI